MKKSKHLILTLAIIIISVIADQVTKLMAQDLLLNKGFVGVIGDAIGFELVYNPGAFLGMFSQMRWAFMIPSAVFIVLMIAWTFLKAEKHPLFTVSLGLLIGGGIGNMIDRVRLEYVIDFISLKFINFPNFNVADSCVTIGCVMLAVYVFLPNQELFDFKPQAKALNPDEKHLDQ